MGDTELASGIDLNSYAACMELAKTIGFMGDTTMLIKEIRDFRGNL